MKLPWIIALILAVVVIILILTRPSGGSDAQNKREDAYRNQIALLQLEKDSLKALQSKIILEVSEEHEKDSIELESIEREIRVLKTRLTQQRPQVQPYLDSIPVLKQFVETQDSVIQTQDSTLAVYQQSLYDLGRQFTVLEGTIYDSRQIEERMMAECESRRAELLSQVERMEKKNRKKVKIWKSVAVALGVGGLFLGSQL
jgi:chromosome segregation ATPase